MSLASCFDRGYLRKITPEPEKVRSSLKQSMHCLSRAKGVMKLAYYDIAFAQAYNSMLQTARAILFRDGIKERSHECVAVYLKERYSNSGFSDYIDVFDNYRASRHFIQYEGGLCTKESAMQSIEDSEKFLELVKKELAAGIK